MPKNILVVDDDPVMRQMLGSLLGERGYTVDQASSAEEALAKVKRHPYELILLDVVLPGLSGTEAIPGLRQISPYSEIIMITGSSSKDIALEAIKQGAHDCFTKPFSMDEMEIVIRRTLEKQSLKAELNALRKQLATTNLNRLVGESQCIQQVKNLVAKLAPIDSTVLITGESGTGKEVVADVLHAMSSRSTGPFVKINCAAIPEHLLESELFGHVRGAFTGAVSEKPGKFELACKGTILLDEIGDMPLDLQVKLLRVVDQKEVTRLGGKQTIPINARIIASTNRDLKDQIRDRRFREDLFYRLNVASIHLPPLRERKEDLPVLTQHFLQRINIRLGMDLTGVSRKAMEVLFDYDFPGNVRELANLLERAAILGEGPVLGEADIRAAFQRYSAITPAKGAEEHISLTQTLQDLERVLIVGALEKAGGSQTEAAKLLGLTPKNLWKKIRKHHIDKKRRPGNRKGSAEPECW